MKRMTAAIVLAVALAGCGGDSADRSQGCEEAEAWVRLAAQGPPDMADMERTEDMRAAANKIRSTWEGVAAAAPDDVRESMSTIDRIDQDTIRLAEQEERAEAWDVMNTWIINDCGLSVPR